MRPHQSASRSVIELLTTVEHEHMLENWQAIGIVIQNGQGDVPNSIDLLGEFSGKRKLDCLPSMNSVLASRKRNAPSSPLILSSRSACSRALNPGGNLKK